MKFSVIIPVYNRPDELGELLQSLKTQNYHDFEVIVIEDGSTIDSSEIIEVFKSQLPIQYLIQPNTGQGFARNNGMEIAKGDFFVILDSDVLLPEDYLQKLSQAIQDRNLDAFGGPDAAGENFSALQKAMDFAMTSVWTTGGIRGKMKDPSKYQARGFNMGVSKAVFEVTGGFADPNQGEDIEWSIRIKKAGFKLELVREAFVYHKRKNTLLSFAKQAFSFGRNRVNVSRFHPGAIKLVHWLPTAFLLFSLSIPVFYYFNNSLFVQSLGLLLFWSMGVILTSSIQNSSIKVGLLSLMTSASQLWSYGLGLPFELLKKAFSR
ncbi:glycosyltransferase [Algoriphagus yeomjeoni]|uniref:Cellulose synthase/poly-beta-1,6-N-acetylglucosamine synthase-like glycosyltransferase n=1 Tax=Algoriphagus yeomjeoni TaxID=291403 RepID=A0A327PKW8_9BACT|nr:glycosyltransferase [Algoriphagus yeomjeoni]RAI91894.1 cellulose synthase/poly-beta-1,6-N-acetylglucosamine synthase-like glycosyltransferase [Algoriphagus yeomjeoni]